MNTEISSRENNIRKLEALAREVLTLKNQHRQRRPIVIEFCGSPKAGKTSSINSLNIFLKRNGFKTTILTERASVCPISDKTSPTFNVWTCSATINEINAEINKANLAEGTGPDIIICDRGIFDALCWFRWLKSRNQMGTDEYNVLTEFAMLNRWQRNIDLVYVFITDPAESIKREYAHLLTNKRGSIMREDVLAEYLDAVQNTLAEYKDAFRATSIIDTTNRQQNDVGYEVTEKTLETLRDMLMEKIGYIASDIPSNLIGENGLVSLANIVPLLDQVKFELRDKVEENAHFIQPIAIAVILSKNDDKILCVKKSPKSTGSDSPESGQTLLYVGGHMRKEDVSRNGKSFLDIARNTLQREILEELGISIAISKNDLPSVIYTPSNEKSKKHIAIVWTISIDEETKLRLDSYELVQKKGKSKSGCFIPFSNITDPDISLESWSRTILLEILPDKLTAGQIEKLRYGKPTQLAIDLV